MTRRKIFTLTKANRTLPLVQRVVRDIREKYVALQVIRRSQAQLSEDEIAAREHEAFQLEGQIFAHVSELNAIGCELKDYEKGLIDFYADKGGEIIYLCWMLGEDDIQFWHPLEGGFAARQPVSALPRATLGQ
ncbi:MAG: DUF2203 domain-containing protein [Planctomycetota bacterium]